MEEDLKQLISKHDLSSLFSVTDSRGIIVYVSKQFATLTQYSPAELTGQNHRVLKSGLQPAALFEELWATISKGNTWQGEIKNRAKDGSYFWVKTVITPVIDQNNRAKYYVANRSLLNRE